MHTRARSNPHVHLRQRVHIRLQRHKLDGCGVVKSLHRRLRRTRVRKLLLRTADAVGIDADGVGIVDERPVVVNANAQERALTCEEAAVDCGGAPE